MIEVETVNIKHLQGSVALKADVELKQDENHLWRCYESVTGVGVKKVICGYNLCKRYRVKPLLPPTKAILPHFRTDNVEPFAVSVVNFAEPLKYKVPKNSIRKCYVALFTCASTRAIHLKLCHDLSSVELQRILKKFVARKGPPLMIISDNAKTFLAIGKWLLTLKNDENLANYLAIAPWWGGLFEKLIGIMKKSLSKTIGKGMLSFNELEKVLLDFECSMNNRPLCYQGDQFDNQVLTPNVLMRGKPVILLEEDIDLITKRWMSEYVTCNGRTTTNKESNVKLPVVEGVVLVKDMKNKALLKIGQVESKIKEKDGVTCGLKIRLGNGYVIERPIQLVCNLKINYEAERINKSKKNVEIGEKAET
ncbi:uncharacterized protein LOC136086875 [Hydra vulgaris]|uniref:Uncharacterized protein LOC136086875 n=1 Tax=Hydra vulgaris TaxID=6087 RepID=A0ABM4CU42_HYDVU